MVEIKVEQWLGNEIRFVEVNGEWRAVAKDVTDALGLSQVSRAINRLKAKGGVTTSKVTDALGREQDTSVINEASIYRLAFSSRKPEAEDFQDWVIDTIKALRESVGLEQYEAFEMMRKENMKQATDVLKNGIDNAEPKHYAKAHTIANKAVSNMYGFDKLVQVKDMTPDMLRDRQNIYEAVIEVMIANDRYNLGLSVSKTIYDKFGV